MKHRDFPMIYNTTLLEENHRKSASTTGTMTMEICKHAGHNGEKGYYPISAYQDSILHLHHDPISDHP